MQLPATFGKYELLERIATGGMAEVYLARSFGIAGFEKRLVIKRIRPELAQDPHHVNLFIKMDSEPQPTEEEKEVDAEVQRVRELLSQSVDELDLSVRAHNCLKAANIKTIGDLVRREESEMLKFRNFGRKSLQELMQVIEERNLQFGMDVDRFLDDVKS